MKQASRQHGLSNPGQQLELLTAKAQTADKRATAAEQKARLAKAKFKAARKAFKQAKKAARKIAKQAKRMRKELVALQQRSAIQAKIKTHKPALRKKKRISAGVLAMVAPLTPAATPSEPVVAAIPPAAPEINSETTGPQS